MDRVGIIICDRYKSCDGGKCFRSVREREGSFERYAGKKLELIGYSSCGGCPGGNIEYVATNMKKYGANVIHFATGFLAGYPPCPRIDIFKAFIEKNIGLEVVVGTHPMPTNYIENHNRINDIPEKYKEYWDALCDKKGSAKYDSTSPNYVEELKKELMKE